MTDLHPLDLRRIPRNLPSSAYKVGNEFAPFHPSASHVPPEYRDGWNRCWLAAQPALAIARAAQAWHEADAYDESASLRADLNLHAALQAFKGEKP